MEFVYQLNVDNYLMNELVIYNNGGSDEIRINYKELTKDIYDYYINRTDLTPPETSYNEFEEHLSLFENFKDIKTISHKQLDYFKQNIPGEEPRIGKPIIQDMQVPSQNTLYNQTKSPGNCAMILKTAQDLISTDGINIDNNDEVAKQIEECAKQTGLHVDITLNSKVNKMPIVDNISANISSVNKMPIYVTNKHPVKLTNTNMTNLKAPDYMKDGACLRGFPANMKQNMTSNEIEKYSIERCRNLCRMNEDCNYIWVYTSGPNVGRCCPKESIDLSQGYVNKQGGAFMEIK